MNYYRRYSGDYLRDTARLTLTEHGAYTLMLDYYYSDEQPLPVDRDEIYLLVRAMRTADQRAVDKVLSLYFELREDGYHQKRVDAEIAASKSARDNGKLGGRKPAGEPKGKPRQEPKQEPLSGTETGTETGTQEATEFRHPPTSNLQPREESNGGQGTEDLHLRSVRVGGDR